MPSIKLKHTSIFLALFFLGDSAALWAGPSAEELQKAVDEGNAKFADGAKRKEEEMMKV